MEICIGFEPEDRTIIAVLYWDAFGGKLGRVLGPDAKAVPFIAAMLSPDHALCARNAAGQVVGVAGFKTYDGALVNAGLRDMAAHYGWPGGLWRIGLLALLEREVDNERFLLDGICVSAAARGMGVGTLLLDAVADQARARGYSEIRLDVIDNNARARALYERQGFVAGKTSQSGMFRFVFGFRSATTMVRKLG